MSEGGDYGPMAQRIMREALDCLHFLDSYLEYEEWVMEQIEAAQEAQDDDDGVEMGSEDEGYNSDDEGVSENDIDDWVFGLAPILMNIHL